MRTVQNPGKCEIPLNNGLKNILINGVIILKTKHLRVKYNCLFFKLMCGGAKTVEFSPIDKYKTLPGDIIRFHIDAPGKVSGFQIYDFNLFVPVMFHAKTNSTS